VAAITMVIGTNNSAAAVREILYPPPSDEDTNSLVGQQRYYNKAQVIVLVSNTTAFALIKTDITDASPITVDWTSLSNCVRTNFTFTDQREASRTVKVTQIDVGKFSRWLSTNIMVLSKLPDPTNSPLVVYVADYRTTTSTTLNALRLTNGVALPAGGLTFATPNPLYVWGNYNCPDTNYLGTTNTTVSAPASLLCDAITILSPNWNDGLSVSSYTSRNAANTTINAAIVAGAVYSTSSNKVDFSGGVHNLPRLLENWNGDVLTLNGSLVNLFDSAQATNKFIYPDGTIAGQYFQPPTRGFYFDGRFYNSSNQPPGAPAFVQVVVVNPIIITNQPQSLSVVTGQTASFTVGATNYYAGPMMYQWYFNTDILLADATNAAFVIADVQSTNAGSYQVVVTADGNSVTSSVAMLTALYPPTITALQAGVPGPNTNTLTFAGIPNYQYVIQFATNLPDSPWFVLATNTADTNGCWTVTDSDATNAQRYYRCVAP
jgi:hypothetical protein